MSKFIIRTINTKVAKVIAVEKNPPYAAQELSIAIPTPTSGKPETWYKSKAREQLEERGLSLVNFLGLEKQSVTYRATLEKFMEIAEPFGGAEAEAENENE